ncbi:MAG TPA: zf-TFIIB domain-containing protein [Devosia sp.]|jgi:hypothetical protein|nr:zf-TFIIB domain-containing protein [Devosia sp.]
MKCPIDNAELIMTERQGIEIDYCPHCRGVWLDRGELDKIIERSATQAPPMQQAAPPPRPDDRYRDDRPRDDRYRDDRYRDDYNRKPYKKRESFLGELFDF